MPYEYNDDLLWQIECLKSTSELKKFIKSHNGKFDPYTWFKITTHKHFGFSAIPEDNIADLSWEEISTSFQLTEEQLEKYAYYLNWYCISSFQKLSAKFIKKYKDELSLDQLISNEKLEKDARNMANKMYNENNDMEHHIIWRDNLKNALTFRPKLKMKIGLNEEEKLYKSVPAVEVIDTLQKDELKAFLDNLGVKYLYKNTLQELREMLKEKKEQLKPKAKRKNNNEYDKYLLDKINRNNPIPVKEEPQPEKVEEIIPDKKEEQPVKKVRKKKKLDYSKMSKAELKKILEKRKVRVYYHDTLEILRNKCLESENAN